MKKKLTEGIEDIKTIKNSLDGVRRNSSFKAIFFTIIIIFFTYLFIAQSLTVVQLRYQMADVQTELENKENENKILMEQIQKKTTDQYIEEMARDRLGMVKSSETPIKIIEKEVERKEEVYVEPNEKIGIYMKDWYLELEKYIKYLKKK